ncbi:MAG: class III signal peptide-containing protein [Candidatus ainarchaeum sp.]|nr:class III signal peptide-containing protein [Candidatus ainarchaeum sp.]
MNTKGQGALEYLLIIGGAVIVAGIVLTLLMGASGPAKCSTQDQLANSLCAKNSIANCPTADVDGTGGTACAANSCQLDTTGNICMAKPAGATPTGRGANCFPC